MMRTIKQIVFYPNAFKLSETTFQGAPSVMLELADLELVMPRQTAIAINNALSAMLTATSKES